MVTSTTTLLCSLLSIAPSSRSTVPEIFELPRWWWPTSAIFGYFEPDGLPVARVLLDTPPGGEALEELDAPAAGLVRCAELGSPRVLIADLRVDPVPEQGHRDVDNSGGVPDRVGHDFREQ